MSFHRILHSAITGLALAIAPELAEAKNVAFNVSRSVPSKETGRLSEPSILVCFQEPCDRAVTKPTELDSVNTVRQLNALKAAKQRWAARPFSNYHMALTSGRGDCQQEVEIQDELVVAIQSNCKIGSSSLLTVTNLFSKVEGYLTKRACGSNGCKCDGVIVPTVIYDSQFGYPRQIKTRLQKISAPSGQICTRIGFSGDKISVQSLTPIEASSDNDELENSDLDEAFSDDEFESLDSEDLEKNI